MYIAPYQLLEIENEVGRILLTKFMIWANITDEVHDMGEYY